MGKINLERTRLSLGASCHLAKEQTQCDYAYLLAYLLTGRKVSQLGRMLPLFSQEEPPEGGGMWRALKQCP